MFTGAEPNGAQTSLVRVANRRDPVRGSPGHTASRQSEGSNKRRVAEKNLGLFLSPGGDYGGGILTPMNSLSVGPGEPGPGDEWQIPAEQIDGPTGEDGPTTEPTRPTDGEARRREP